MNNNVINKFKESKENQQDDIYFIKYTSYSSNIIHGGIYAYLNNEVYVNLISNSIFDYDEYHIIETIKLDNYLGAFIKFIIKYFSDNAPTLYRFRIPKEKEVKNNNEYNTNSINDQFSENNDITAPITLEELKDISNFYDISQVTKHVSMIKDNILYPTTSGYINLNNSEITYDSPVSDKDWKCMVLLCCESETFIIIATGDEKTRPYAFVDENYHILQKAELNEVCYKKEVTAPEGSLYLIVNSKDVLYIEKK